MQGVGVPRSSRFKNNCFAVMRSSSGEGSYSKLVDVCITQLQAESNKEEKKKYPAATAATTAPEASVQVSGFYVFNLRFGVWGACED